tara:strand:+ start:138 stop:383 length:246 start_codon:yes stop_codon:yes gene_type:complete
MNKNLKSLYLKSALLCDKYSDSLEYDKCDYHLVELFDSSKILMLIKIDNGKILAKGNLNRIKSYINLRKIDHKKIYKWIDV